MKTRIKIQGFLIFLAVAALAVFHKQILPSEEENFRILEILDVAGWVLVFTGYFFRICARGYKADANPDGKKLVIDGPYGLTRNPMYFGTLLIGIGISLMLFKWWVAIIFLAVYLSIYIPQMNRETKKLSALFGNDFENYRKSTPQYFPRISAFRQRAGQGYLVFKLKWAKKEIFSFLPTLVLLTAGSIWEQAQLYNRFNIAGEFLKISLAALIFLAISAVIYGKKDIPKKS